ncbi:unnamed protein product [Allacma fusca]|uniref:Uncharacterized protein n=1 Tax=Allacma fusca TaxID=39272 RepID=A0A8J2KE54_9HEXA|nr:unnamed protein product [Allacma fusca]
MHTTHGLNSGGDSLLCPVLCSAITGSVCQGGNFQVGYPLRTRQMAGRYPQVILRLYGFIFSLTGGGGRIDYTKG